MKKETQKHFDIKVTPETHYQVKLRCAQLGLTVTDYLNELMHKDLSEATEPHS